MKKIILFFYLLISIVILFPEEVQSLPNIIFIHGISGEPQPDLGEGVNDENDNRLGTLWSWHPLHWDGSRYIEIDSTALLKIIGYRGYKKGSPFDCTIDSNPRDVSGSVVYNFSYYNPDGSSGVIGGGEDSQHNPKYIPESVEYQDYYTSHFKNGQWAKNVSEFIKKGVF